MSDNTTHEDRSLVEGIIRGDEAAFLRIFEKYHSPLYLHVLRFAKSEDLAKDIVQEVFIKVWENKNALNAELCFKGYLFKMCKNRIINFLKRAARETAIQKELSYHAHIASNQLEENYTYSEYESLARKAIQLLPPKRQVVFRMCRLEGKDYDEVAASLHISKHTVRDHMAKAVKSIKDYFSVHADISFVIFYVMFFPAIS